MKENKNRNYDDHICPKCGASSVFIPPVKEVVDTLTLTYRCLNDHTFMEQWILVNGKNVSHEDIIKMPFLHISL